MLSFLITVFNESCKCLLYLCSNGKFDESSGVNQRQTNYTDPQTRLLLEKTTEAILDAAFNPADLEGTRTGVFIAASTMESEILVCPRQIPKTDALVG